MSARKNMLPGSGGGSIAIRGLLVQTLVALLDITTSKFPFIEITLEPAIGDEQFDFVWKNENVTHAVQVKSTKNHFKNTDVKKWAAKLQKARSTENCTLVLVGKTLRPLKGPFGEVKIEKKPTP